MIHHAYFIIEFFLSVDAPSDVVNEFTVYALRVLIHCEEENIWELSEKLAQKAEFMTIAYATEILKV